MADPTDKRGHVELAGMKQDLVKPTLTCGARSHKTALFVQRRSGPSMH